jgi:hypothetical protein
MKTMKMSACTSAPPAKTHFTVYVSDSFIMVEIHDQFLEPCLPEERLEQEAQV